MIGGNRLRFFAGCGNKSASGQIVGFSEEAARSLMDGGDGGSFKGIVLESGDFEMMCEVTFHSLPIHRLEVASGHDSGSKRNGGAVEQVVGQVVLPGEGSASADAIR